MDPLALDIERSLLALMSVLFVFPHFMCLSYAGRAERQRETERCRDGDGDGPGTLLLCLTGTRKYERSPYSKDAQAEPGWSRENVTVGSIDLLLASFGVLDTLPASDGRNG